VGDQVRFGPFAFTPGSGELLKHGVPVRLQPQPARVLATLVGRRGEVVAREELRQQIWPTGTFVDFERGLNFAVAHVRAALGDSADAPVYIETLPKRGYRFIAPIASEPAVEAAPVAPMDPPSRPRRPSAVALAAAALAVATLVGGLWWFQPSAARAVRVAVVPFDNETGQDAFDRVAVAIADQTVARLATRDRLPRLSVVGNSAVLRRPRAFRDIKEIGRGVDAEYVVLAQMKVDQSKVRLIAHLIRVSDEAHVWADVFDRNSFTLDVQAEIAEAIARAVTGRLTAS
jgi:DNA-binding winged helix-turn-helix (wHTH) protein/TolB-like protein